ncbi:serine hydrolase [Maribellus comscasis]|uniref:Serine hydrolase n=1 Tax=Maribellus comscasis TaxID=2681766 RepID=A0A6I6JZX2_9BACT|nr:serine hydrolase domain-containing protein [Maribellus comscasis]QGY45712.1 serine hydrolase [Maribellus comscasis]
MTKKQTKQILRIGLLVGTIVSMFFVPWILIKAWITPLPKTVQEQLDESLKYGFDGIIVYIDQAGKEPGFYAAGWHDRKSKIPADPQALFKIASISKLYVAVAVAKLVNDKHLSLDKTLADYFPALVERIENADKITLRMMVQHRSGIPNFTDTPGYWGHLPKDNRENLELVLDKPAEFEPDKKYSYSNTNYLLIREILDKTLGYSYHQYIKREILKPLGLNNTYSLLSEVDLDDVMSGYDVSYDGDLKNTAGSMVATAEDVGIFLRALNDGSLLNDNEQTIYSSIYEYGHTGLLPGYSGIARYHKDIDAVVVQFVNTSGGYTWNLSEIVYKRIVKILRRERNS